MRREIFGRGRGEGTYARFFFRANMIISVNAKMVIPPQITIIPSPYQQQFAQLQTKGNIVPVAPINPIATTLCALSAQILPRSTMRSNVLIWSSFACFATPRSRATRCCGVSPVAPAAGGARVNACGPVAVNRVASATERGGAIVFRN